MTSSVEPEISKKMLRNLSEKLRAKLPATTHGYSMVKFACHIIFELEASPVEVNHCSTKIRAIDKGKVQNNFKKMKRLQT